MGLILSSDGPNLPFEMLVSCLPVLLPAWTLYPPPYFPRIPPFHLGILGVGLWAERRLGLHMGRQGRARARPTDIIAAPQVYRSGTPLADGDTAHSSAS